MSARAFRGMLSGWWRGEQGVAALELGLMAPFLVLLLVSVVELGTGMYEAMQVQAAAEAGAIYASKYGYDAAAISASVSNATGSDAITATPTPTQFCACASESGLAELDCATQCNDGSSPGQYVLVSARRQHEPLVSLPGFGMPGTVTGIAVMRLQ